MFAADKKRVADAQDKLLGVVTPDEKMHYEAMILANGDMTMYHECKNIMQRKDPSADRQATLAETIAAQEVSTAQVDAAPTENVQEPSIAAKREGKEEHGGRV